MSAILNSSSGIVSSSIALVSDSSSFLSITTYAKNAINPMQRPIKATKRGRETSTNPVTLAMGMENPNAMAVPIRAMATCMPMAIASSFPLNHFTMIFDAVIPVTSTPTANVAKPIQAQNSRASKPKSVTPSSAGLEIPQYLMAVPNTINAAEPTPVIRIPNLSRIIPPKININRNTLNQPYELV